MTFVFVDVLALFLGSFFPDVSGGVFFFFLGLFFLEIF